MAKIKPLPGLIVRDGKEWHIEFSLPETNHGATDLAGHKMMIPGERDEIAGLVRFHENVHVAISPDKRKADRFIKKYRPGMGQFSVLAAEDYRVSCFTNHNASGASLPWDEKKYLDMMYAYMHPKDEKVAPDSYKFACMMAANFMQAPHGELYEMIDELKADPLLEDYGLALDSFYQWLQGRVYYTGNVNRSRSRMWSFKKYNIPVADKLECFRILDAAKQEELDDNKGQKRTTKHGDPTEGADAKGCRWLPVIVKRPDLTVDAEVIQAHNPKEYGIEIAYPEREFLDDKVFADQLDKPQGSVALDMSGSMHPQYDEILRFVQNVPASTVIAYSGRQYANAGEVVVVAENGRCIEEMPKMPGENLCDVTVLDMLAKMPEPRFWVSDGRATKVNQRGQIYFGPETVAEATQFAVAHNIKRVHSIEEALALITGEA